ncbi:type II secretion system GspH family protein [Planctomycetaceae bacterium]|nr:type II secretion system GspH family protein [bacterium]MDC0261819.1 type II secretion system GspH family protein [Planctomycetaceae bacterium]MDC0274193.1 type II secretion system GspH family protein [Planctomycetaceae bacterium]MDG2390175.1 type II secretion system protein [Planctomycetaceae bacterium]
MRHTISQFTKSRTRQSRDGITSLELIVSMILIGMLISTIMPMVRWAGHQKRESERRTLAIEIVTNQLEELAVKSYEELTEFDASLLKLTDEQGRLLPESELMLHVKPTSAAPIGKQIKLSLSWTNSAGQPARPVKLTTIVYPPGGQP